MRPKQFLLATTSEGKVHEYRNYLKDFDFEFVYLSDLDFLDDPEETEQTFKENALLKARYYAVKTGLATLADDSGISINALDGFPGVHSKRYAERFPTYVDVFRDLSNRLEGKEKSATMVCAIAFIDPLNVIEEVVEARVPGQLIFDEDRFRKKGFGYDPVFQPEGHHKTYAEDMDMKHRISHRRSALTLMAKRFKILWDTRRASS